MFKALVKVTKRLDKTHEVLGNLDALGKADVLVGVTQERSSRKGESITNAELAYIHTHGSPKMNIPARPFLEPSILANKAMMAKFEVQIIQDVLQGRSAGPGLNRLGALARDNAKAWFVDSRNGWAPNAPITIARKGSDRPLINIGVLRNSITYVVREK